VTADPQYARSLESGFWITDAEADARLEGETAQHLALRWVLRLRYGLIAGEIALIFGLYFGLNIPLPLLILGPTIVGQSLSNWFLGSRKEKLGRTAEHLVGALFVLDALCLSLILAFSGGPANPFSLLYLVQITFSAVVLRKIWTWILGVISTLSFGLLFWISKDVPAFHEHSQSGEFSLHLFGMWMAFAAGALLISFFVGKMSSEARRKEREIRWMQKRLAKNDRLASLITLAAGAAHEISTPLSTIAVTAKEMERDAASRPGNETLVEDARLVRSQVERCRQIVERMGAQGADPFGESPTSTSMQLLFAQVVERFPQERERLRIQTEGPAGCIVPTRATIEALSALVKNAIDASPDGKPIVLRAIRSESGLLRFWVRDEGVGMPPEVLERVAEPFFTTKPVGQGMGLGAFLAHLFAQTLGGQLSFQSAPGRGCTAILEIPEPRYVKP
jgi:two-component system, sensor histidine kinase RegB